MSRCALSTFGLRHTITFCLALALGLGWVANTSAATLYTVNSLSDRLVKINTNTGATTVVGPIGFDMHGTELALFNGELYALTSDTDNVFNQQPNYTLLKIDRQTGAMISSVAVKQSSGAAQRLIEGMGAAAGKLWIGGNPAGLVSNYLGQINPATGVISNQLDYNSVPGMSGLFGGFGTDFDSLSQNAANPNLLVAFDGDFDLISLVNIDPENVTGSRIAQFFLTTGITDVASSTAGLFLLGNGNLYKVTPTAVSNAPIVNTIPLSPVGAFTGLAVPEPSSMVLSLVAAGLLSIRALRRRARS